MTDSAIEIRGLEKKFPKFRLGPLDLTVPRGAIYGLIGPNGAGKTTTIDMVMNMGRNDAGKIQVFGLDHREHEMDVKLRIGYVSPDVSFSAWRKVKRLIHFVRSFYPDWDDAYCTKLLDQMGIGWNDKIGTMSFGTRVKLSLVLALAHKPDLLLLDEPTIGVDAVSKQQIFSELLATVQNEDRTVLISSHGLTDIERFTDHVGMIKDGAMLLEGPTGDIVERFRVVDFEYNNGAPPPAVPGAYMQERSGNRWRALLDTEAGAREALQAKGAREVSDAPVTLEELFVALAKEE